MYFKNYKEKKNSKASTMLKLYLKVNDSHTRDYIFLEAFDFKPAFSDQFISRLHQNTLLGAWAATQFEPIESYFGEDESVIVTSAVSSTKYWVCTKTFYYMGEDQTHTIRWFTNTDYSDVPVGQEAKQYYTLKVYDKSQTHTKNTNYNSDTESYLHVNALSLDQISIPNTAWKTTEIDGLVQNNGWGGELSASLGVSLGALDLTYSFPITFTDSGYVDINETYDSYVNGVNGKYTRSINTEMDSDFKLTQEGHYFQVDSVLRDYGNVTRSAQTLKAKWHIEIINAGPMTTYNYYCDHDVSVAIK